MVETRAAGKSFDIPKRLVWNAYLKVKAHRGAAGVDGQSVAEFEQDEKNNLYKLWNRLWRTTRNTGAFALRGRQWPCPGP